MLFLNSCFTCISAKTGRARYFIFMNTLGVMVKEKIVRLKQRKIKTFSYNPLSLKLKNKRQLNFLLVLRKCVW